MLSRHRPPPRQRALLHRLFRQFDELASVINALKAENDQLRKLLVYEMDRATSYRIAWQGTCAEELGEIDE